MVSLLPDSAYDIGIDPGWRTYVKMIDQVIEVEDREPVTVKAGSLLRIFRQYDGRTYSSGNGPVIEDCSDEITEIDAPVAPGETVYFEWMLLITGSPDENYAVCVHTPTNPTGGFQVIGRSAADNYQGGCFGADDFNSPAGVFKGGAGETGYATVRVRGSLGCGYQPGRLVLQLAPAEEPAAPSPGITGTSWLGAGGSISLPKSAPGAVGNYYLFVVFDTSGLSTDFSWTADSIQFTALAEITNSNGQRGRSILFAGHKTSASQTVINWTGMGDTGFFFWSLYRIGNVDTTTPVIQQSWIEHDAAASYGYSFNAIGSPRNLFFYVSASPGVGNGSGVLSIDPDFQEFGSSFPHWTSKTEDDPPNITAHYDPVGDIPIVEALLELKAAPA